ncbi:MAG: sulfotransferase [Thermaurantimonas sp.]|uniref:sulfotransferase n=1 Tax=Thermaurantimonas sp. TaxID=2681568 RepID=UPI00391B65AC
MLRQIARVLDPLHPELYKPVIIMGMHRSGTSFLAEVLHRAGIHMGVKRDHNFEAFHFLSINQRAMWQAGGDWYKPVVPASEHFDKWTAEELFKIHFGLKGNGKYILYKLINKRWGWKDPRNTFTLPFWLNQFPQAKVIHLIRNGWDVALSLQKRNQKLGEVYKAEFDNPLAGFNLWNIYITKAFSYEYSNIHHVKYEDLMKKNSEEISRLENFLKVFLKKYIDHLASKPNVRSVRFPEEVRQNVWMKKFYDE